MRRPQLSSVGAFSTIATLSDQSDSQDILFHTMLGMMDIETSVCEKEVDILSLCKPICYVKK